MRFLRARGVAVLFPLGFEASGTAPERGAGEIPLEDWVAQSVARMRADLDRLGFSFDWSRGFSSADPEVYRWSEPLFGELLEAGLVVEREGSVAWCERCSTVLAPGQVHGSRCGLCDRAVSLTRRRGWYLRTSHLNADAEERLDDLDGLDDAAIVQQRAALGRVDGVELEATALDGAALTLFTPLTRSVASGELALLSPNHPDLDRWAGDADVAQEAPRAARRRLADRLREPREGWSSSTRGSPSSRPSSSRRSPSSSRTRLTRGSARPPRSGSRTKIRSTPRSSASCSAREASPSGSAPSGSSRGRRRAIGLRSADRAAGTVGRAGSHRPLRHRAAPSRFRRTASPSGSRPA